MYRVNSDELMFRIETKAFHTPHKKIEVPQLQRQNNEEIYNIDETNLPIKKRF